MAGTKVISVIFVEKKSLQFYSSKTGVLSPKLTEKVYKDMDVVDATALTTQIRNLITKNKIEPSGVILVYAASICFSKDLPASQNAQMQEALKGFAEKVPFESVFAKDYKTTKGVRLVAVNRGIYDVLRSAFEREGFEFVSAIPALLLGANFNKQATMDVALAKSVLNNLEKLATRGFMSQSEEQVKEDAAEKKSFFAKNKKLVMLAGIFVVGLIVLLVLLLAR